MKYCNFLFCIIVLLASAVMPGCEKSDGDNSLQPKIDSVNNITLIARTNIKLGGRDSVALNRAYGFAANVPYPYRSLTAGAVNIDLIFDQGKFWNIDPITNSTATGTGAKFLVTALTPAQFDAVTSKAQLTGYGLKATEDAVPVSAGKVFFVRTKEGYDCLVKVNTLFPPSGSVTFDYKIAVK